MKKNLVPLIAMAGGLTLIIVAISLQGKLSIFWSLSSMIITVLGSWAALMVSYPLKEMLKVPKIVKKVLENSINRRETIDSFTEMSKKARREGILSLEDEIDLLEDEFLMRGIQMVVDGAEPENIRNTLELEMDMMELRHKLGQGIFKSWGDLAPAFGMIGTLIGLILMLSDLQNADAIGIGMATALITTFYGALISNLILLPISANLKIQSEDELLTREMMIEGILSIQAGSNPRVIEEKLITYLSPSERLEEKDKGLEMVLENE